MLKCPDELFLENHGLCLFSLKQIKGQLRNRGFEFFVLIFCIGVVYSGKVYELHIYTYEQQIINNVPSNAIFCMFFSKKLKCPSNHVIDMFKKAEVLLPIYM
jgi:hypothetical protein